VNPLIYLANQLTRGFQSADNQFQALQTQATESFQSMVPDFNPAYCTDLSPSLAFSASIGFGTWRIFVPSSISCITNF
jgi:hypothetical protein